MAKFRPPVWHWWRPLGARPLVTARRWSAVKWWGSGGQCGRPQKECHCCWLKICKIEKWRFYNKKAINHQIIGYLRGTFLSRFPLLTPNITCFSGWAGQGEYMGNQGLTRLIITRPVLELRHCISFPQTSNWAVFKTSGWWWWIIKIW